ncbi:CPBP family intramembrane glutamic endopeptidase [Microbulbifer guangxiensis]|uniref:CPBP family intramembrane glutamic endopeptidase n=1 Tax=Microbulbifer guangxiensis TaxID=2904249 RepID=UPI001F17BEBD|nr:CPBP family intramembrane glutamic endopeptidase [Microbulbifer guangxiensis]
MDERRMAVEQIQDRPTQLCVAVSGPGHRRGVHQLAGAALLLSACAIPFGWVGLAAPLVLLFLCAIEVTSGWRRGLAYLGAAVVMLLAALGVVPGSERIELLPAYTDASGNLISAGFNPGKAAIATGVLAFMLRRGNWLCGTDLRHVLLAIVIPSLCGLALFGLSPKFAAVILAALLINFLVVAISEEAFFRWILQRGGERLLPAAHWLIALLVTALFTFLHTGWAASAPALIVVAVAGLTYACLWWRTRNFWACVLAHGGINGVHMFLLPYPLPA